MSRVAGGDADALGELYDRYGGVVFGLIYRMLGSPESAEEVAQNAFHSVWRQASRYRPERGSVRTWLLAIARNAAIDWRRSKGNRTGRETAIDDTLMLVDERRVEDTVIASLRAQRVRAAVASLPREQRETLSLAFWSGLSQTEIAARTGRRPPNELCPTASEARSSGARVARARRVARRHRRSSTCSAGPRPWRSRSRLWCCFWSRSRRTPARAATAIATRARSLASRARGSSRSRRPARSPAYGARS